jgi:hypothetical protein
MGSVTLIPVEASRIETAQPDVPGAFPRELLASHAGLAGRLKEMESKYDKQFAVVFDAIRKLMEPSKEPMREMGFHTLIRKKKR